jgi:hypothetical protein
MRSLKEFWRTFNFGSAEQSLAIVCKGVLFCGLVLLADVLIPLLLLTVIVFASFVANVVFHSGRNVGYRLISPDAPVCAAFTTGSDILTSHGNDETLVMDTDRNSPWERIFKCSLQRHLVPNYVSPSGTSQKLAYNLAFVELQEDGQPYELTDEAGQVWHDSKRGGQPIGQLDSLLDHLSGINPQYVVVFIHGWRHDASIGDGNVGDLRVYAAHAARFLAPARAVRRTKQTDDGLEVETSLSYDEITCALPAPAHKRKIG